VEVLIVILVVLFCAVVVLPIVAITAINYTVDHNKHGSPEPEWKEGFDD
jgi:hypothetical protein